MPSHGFQLTTVEGVDGPAIDLVAGSGIYIVADDVANTIEIGNTTDAPPISDHGTLTGLLDNDHPQYVSYTGAMGDVILGNHQVIPTVSGFLGRDLDGLAQEVHLGNSRNIIITRIDGLISSFTDGVRTWNITRDVNSLVNGWSVT